MADLTTLPVYPQAVGYVKRTWSIIPVHGYSNGGCTCGSPRCPPASRGKHPVRKAWTEGGPLSLADAHAIWGEDDAPGYNVGIRTGAPSGFFALDIDPKADGLAELAALIERYGPLPDTYTVRTGSGGRHYYFAMPDFDVRNNQHKLAPGIDVRGTGGMVIAPPSVSGIGAYTVVSDVPIVAAPAWLLALLAAGRSDEPVVSVVVEDLPAWSDLDHAERARLDRYARSVVEREADGYARAPAGTGNAALFGAACNALEISQSPWNLLTTDDVVSALESAADRRRQHTEGQAPAEFSRTLQSAAGRVVGQGRQVPPDPADGLMFDPPEGGPVSSPDGPGPVTRISLADQLRARLLSAEQVSKLPNPVPLVNGMLDLDSEAWMIGLPGCFKSFVALDLAAHVAGGRIWQGRAVRGGPVLYMVAEGASGMSMRVRAWKSEHGPMPGSLMFLPLPVQSANAAAWGALVEVAAELKPALVIIDTQARVTVGLNESSSEMGVYVEAVRQLREATGACVLTIHHIGRSGNDARGSSMIDGAQGTEIRLERTDVAGRRGVTLHMDKQKDAPDGAGSEIKLDLKVWDDGVDPETGRRISSLVVTQGNPFSAATLAPMPWRDHLAANQAQIVDVLVEHVDHDGATTTEIRAIIAERFGAMPRGSFNTAFNWLKSPKPIKGQPVGPIVVNGASASRWTLQSKLDALDV